jgi:glutamine synthetase
MNPRFKAIASINKSKSVTSSFSTATSSENFGIHVFNQSAMQKMLPRLVYKNLLNAMKRKEKLSHEFADTIALAMKEWAISHGATHYCHWFQPLTGSSAEKHDSFIDWNTADKVIEKFDGKQLIQGEPDASSFPSGGLRSTYEARGYTAWDPSSPAFLWEGGDGVILCIPSIFFSWTGFVLDNKIPLLRSDAKINSAVLRLLNLVGISAERIYSTLGAEQEYFVIDRELRNLRPDLILIGRTLFGTPSPKSQELQDHYFGAVKDRILAYMRDFELAALKLAIPVKTRHNEVAPAQHEIAPVFEEASVAIDHNILLMELMRQIAVKHDLACLLHEKPFHGINGSGKHCNWSLSTDEGLNLLDPSETPGNNLHFLILLVAILNAVHKHSALLRASIGSASNDCRLGGHEAPPAIISVYLGEELESVLEKIEMKGFDGSHSPKHIYDLGLNIPELAKDHTDRNRTSPFAFTGNKFEFRAVGSSASPALPITVLNAIVAESLHELLDAIEKNLKGKKSPSASDMLKAILPILQKSLKQSKPIRFSGDNYSGEWKKEAKRRGLPNIHFSYESFDALTAKTTHEAFEGILTKNELASRFDIMKSSYAHVLNIEAKLMLDMFSTQILPAAMSFQKEFASSLISLKEALGIKKVASQTTYLMQVSNAIEEALRAFNDLQQAREKVEGFPEPEQAKSFGKEVLPYCEKLRECVDHLETLTDDRLWPLPKYRELLFMV